MIKRLLVLVLTGICSLTPYTIPNLFAQSVSGSMGHRYVLIDHSNFLTEGVGQYKQLHLPFLDQQSGCIIRKQPTFSERLQCLGRNLQLRIGQNRLIRKVQMREAHPLGGNVDTPSGAETDVVPQAEASVENKKYNLIKDALSRTEERYAQFKKDSPSKSLDPYTTMSIAHDFCGAGIELMIINRLEEGSPAVQKGMEILEGPYPLPKEYRDYITFVCNFASAFAESMVGEWDAVVSLGEEFLNYQPPLVNYGFTIQAPPHVIIPIGGLLAAHLSQYDRRLSAEVKIYRYGFLTATPDKLIGLYESEAKEFLEQDDNVSASRLLRMADWIRDIEGFKGGSVGKVLSLNEKIERYRSVGFSERATALEFAAAAEREEQSRKDEELLENQQQEFIAQREQDSKREAEWHAAALSASASSVRRAKESAESRYDKCQSHCTDRALSCTVACYADIKKFDQCALPCNLNLLTCNSTCRQHRETEITDAEASQVHSGVSSKLQIPCNNSQEMREVETLTKHGEENIRQMSVNASKCYIARNYLRIAELQAKVAMRCNVDMSESKGQLKAMKVQEQASCKAYAPQKE